MAKTAPNDPFEDSNTILGDSPGEKVVQNGGQKSIKKPFKKTVVFRSGLGRDFLVFFYSSPAQNGAKMEPGGDQNRYKNHFSSKKRVFVLISENK